MVKDVGVKSSRESSQCAEDNVGLDFQLVTIGGEGRADKGVVIL